MTTVRKPIRQSVSLPARTARRVRALARLRKTSTGRILADLIECGLESTEREKQRFLDLADRLASAGDSAERDRLKKELSRMTFGE